MTSHHKRIVGFISNSKNKEMRLLSNFADTSVVYNGIEYKTVEHAYHALKYLSECTRGSEVNKQRGHDDVKRASTVQEAKKLGGRKGMENYNLTLDIVCWDNRVSVPIMRELILSKIKRHHNVQELLNKYKDCTLVHIAFRGADMKWGVKVDYMDSSNKEIKSVKEGENLLGKIYMDFIQHPELVSRSFEKLIHNLPASPKRNSSPGYRKSQTFTDSDNEPILKTLRKTLKSKSNSNSNSKSNGKRKSIGGPPDWQPGTLNPDWDVVDLSSTSSKRSSHSSRSKSPSARSSTSRLSSSSSRKSPTKKLRPKSGPGPKDIVYDLTDS